MGILDDAIKEHLELKRQHGADDNELRKLEDEAFGESERPGEGSEGQDSLAEAPTEFMSTPDLGESASPEAAPTEGDGLLDWEEPETGSRSARSEAFDLQEPPPEPPAPPESPEVAEEESPAMEHDAFRPPDVSDAEPAVEPEPGAAEPGAAAPPSEEPQPPSHSTAEREAIAEQPTELFDVELEMGPSGGEDPFGAAAPAAPTSAPSGPAGEEGPDDFFDDKRLSDELDEALDAPIEDDHEEEDYDGGDHEEEEEREEPRSGSSGHEEEGDADEDEDDSSLYEAERGEDVLEETPDFLEEAPEDDRLWFEQKPPKDFDFDD